MTIKKLFDFKEAEVIEPDWDRKTEGKYLTLYVFV